MRIAIIGYGAESSTFTRHRLSYADFDVKRGDELEVMFAHALPADVDINWVPLVRAHAGAGGPVAPEAFDAIADEIVAGLRENGPFDGVFIDLHGASHTEGRTRAEEELLHRIRAEIGDRPVISLAMDTHGNFSSELAELVDLAVCFRHAPHIDAWEIRERALRNLVTVLRTGERPHKAYVRVPVLLPGERTSTVVEPAKSAFAGIELLIAQHGVLDASLWVGFFWADEDRNGGAVLVTGYDADAVAACAEAVSHLYWDPRHDFTVVAPESGEWDAALDFALTSPPAPLFISDSGDNVTAGGSGDVTFALERTLARTDVLQSGIRILFASFTDAASVAAAIEAGEGATLRRGLGAVVDDRFGGPVERDWLVERLLPGGLDGEGVVGAVLRLGTIRVIVKTSRTAFYDPAVSSRRHGRHLAGHVWVPLEDVDAVVVKNGYLFPDQAAVAASWFMAITPGGTDLDTDRLGFSRVDRPMYPLDADFEADLTPVLLPLRGATV